MKVRIITGDAREALKDLPADSVQCCVTSPPYYGLRDYGVAGQIGLEPTPDEYVAEMVALFRQVRRVLRDDGTVWLNLGDSYANNAPGARSAVTWPKQARNDHKPTRGRAWGDAKQKDLIGIPWLVAFALRADGWWLRSDIIWAKPNPMPESASDRPTSAHEHVFLLSKSARYFYDADAIREDRTQDEDANTFRGGAYVGGETDNATMGKRRVVGNKRVKVPGGWDRGDGAHGTIHRDGRTAAEYQEAAIKPGRNIRNVWTIATSPFPEAHFATFPPELAKRCIKAGTSEGGCCSTCGAPMARLVEKGAPDLEHQRACGGDAAGEYHGASTKGHAAAGVQDASAVKARILAGMTERRTAGWRQTCECPAAAAVPCVVLDPFGGAGTVGLVADRLNRQAILIELNPEYATMARKRIAGDAGLFAEVSAA